MIYVVQCSIGGPVKIGYTSATESVAARVAALQTACPWPLITLKAFPGSVIDEHALHMRFKQQRLHGEWFAVEGALARWLAREADIAPIEGVAEVQSPVLVVPDAYRAVYDALTDEWQLPGAIAAALGYRNGGSVVIHLNRLAKVYGVAVSRRVALEGRSSSEWRRFPGSHPGLMGGSEIAA